MGTFQYTYDMSKKDFVMQILLILQSKRKPAGDFIKYLNMGALNNEAINALVELLSDMAKFMQDEGIKHKLQKASELLERMRTRELEEMAIDQAEAEGLLASL